MLARIAGFIAKDTSSQNESKKLYMGKERGRDIIIY